MAAAASPAAVNLVGLVVHAGPALVAGCVQVEDKARGGHTVDAKQIPLAGFQPTAEPLERD